MDKWSVQIDYGVADKRIVGKALKKDLALTVSVCYSSISKIENQGNQNEISNYLKLIKKYKFMKNAAFIARIQQIEKLL